MEEGDLEIGEYEEGNIAEILAIERDSYPSPWTESVFRNEITSPISRMLVSRIPHQEGRRVAGYTVYWMVVDEIHLHNIVVRRDMRRRHVATRMLRETIRRARLEGGRRMTLEVRRSNLPARQFYEKFGFSIRGVRHGYYSDTQEDALIMWADLNPVSRDSYLEGEAGEGNDG